MNTIQLPTNFHRELISFLLRAKQNVATVAAQFDLTGPQAFALLLVDAKHPRSMKSYSQAHSCDPANITGIIDGLEDMGLVIRKQDPADRRIKVIYLEPAGAKLREQLLDAIAGVNAELLAPLSAEQQATFASLVRQITDSYTDY